MGAGVVFGNAPPGSSTWNRRDWLGELEGPLKRAVEGQAGRCWNWGSGPFVLALVGGSVSLLPELLEVGGLSCSFCVPGPSECLHCLTGKQDLRILSFVLS